MTSRRERFRNIRHYAVYYGYGEAERLERFDAVVVEPKGQSGDDVKRLQAVGTLAMAYVSATELPRHDPNHRLLKEEDFLRLDGRRASNETFGTDIASLRSKRWLGLLHHQVGSLLLRDGYDGIFLDTIGNVEWDRWPPSEAEEEIRAAAAFVGELRRLFPDRILIQNNGVTRLYRETGAALDAVCWENPPLDNRDVRPWLERAAAELKDASARDNFTVWLLMSDPSEGARGDRSSGEAFAAQNHFLLYHAPPHYLSID